MHKKFTANSKLTRNCFSISLLLRPVYMNLPVYSSYKQTPTDHKSMAYPYLPKFHVKHQRYHKFTQSLTNKIQRQL